MSRHHHQHSTKSKSSKKDKKKREKLSSSTSSPDDRKKARRKKSKKHKRETSPSPSSSTSTKSHPVRRSTRLTDVSSERILDNYEHEKEVFRPLIEFVDDRRKLAMEVLNSVSAEFVSETLPDFKGSSTSELLDFLTDMLKYMSRKRIISILNGQEMCDSSSSCDDSDLPAQYSVILDNNQLSSSRQQQVTVVEEDDLSNDSNCLYVKCDTVKRNILTYESDKEEAEVEEQGNTNDDGDGGERQSNVDEEVEVYDQDDLAQEDDNKEMKDEIFNVKNKRHRQPSPELEDGEICSMASASGTGSCLISDVSSNASLDYGTPPDRNDSTASMAVNRKNGNTEKVNGMETVSDISETEENGELVTIENVKDRIMLQKIRKKLNTFHTADKRQPSADCKSSVENNDVEEELEELEFDLVE